MTGEDAVFLALSPDEAVTVRNALASVLEEVEARGWSGTYRPEPVAVVAGILERVGGRLDRLCAPLVARREAGRP